MGRWTRKISPKVTILFLGPKNKSKPGLALWNAKHNKSATRLKHFHLVEFGSIHGPSQPFMRPAFESTRLVYVRNFGRELARAIEKFAKR